MGMWGAMKQSGTGDFVRRIVFPIAEEDGVDPLDLPPLGQVIAIDALDTVLRSGNGTARVEFEYHGRTIEIESDRMISMSKNEDNDESFVCRCNTCGEAKRNVNHQTAQAFFADHLDRDHAPEIFRVDQPSIDHPTDADGTESGGAARPD